jgi:hypothetical protein
VAGELDVGRRATAAALRDDIACAAFTLSALGGDTEFELNLFKAHACARMANNFTVRDSVADADDHGLACWLMT